MRIVNNSSPFLKQHLELAQLAVSNRWYSADSYLCYDKPQYLIEYNPFSKRRSVAVLGLGIAN